MYLFNLYVVVLVVLVLGVTNSALIETVRECGVE